MFPTPDGRWMVKCKACKYLHKRYRPGYLAESARECHIWWERHAASKTHQRMADWYADTKSDRGRRRSEMMRVFRTLDEIAGR